MDIEGCAVSDERILKILSALSQEWVGKPVIMSPINPLTYDLSVLYVGLAYMTSKKDQLISQRGKIDVDPGATLPRNSLLVDIIVGAKDEHGRALGGRFQGVMTASSHLPRSAHGNLEERLNDFIREGVAEARADYYARLARGAAIHGPVMENLGRARHAPNVSVQFRKWRPNRRALVKALNEASALLARDARFRFPVVEAELFSEHLRFVNSEGAQHSDYFHGIRYELRASMYDDKDRLLEKYASLYTVGDDIGARKLLSRARALERYLKREYNSKRCPLQEPTVVPVLLDHNAAHTFIHETTTHPLELPLILQQGDAEAVAELGLGFSPESFGTRVAAPGVTLKVNPALVGAQGETLWGTSLFDLEGTRAREKFLIRDGILVGAYASRSDVECLRALTGYDVYPGDARLLIDSEETTFPP
ncbi:hypothetical protein D6789_00635, partial [Candidatus Woesearchaeota archaeon]